MVEAGFNTSSIHESQVDKNNSQHNFFANE